MVLTSEVEIDPAGLVQHQVLHREVGQHHAEDRNEEVRLDGDPEPGLGLDLSGVDCIGITLPHFGLV